jgi:predicted transcriptional regulator
MFRFLRYLWPVTTNGLYLAITLTLIADTRLRFDRIAGRMTGGRVATAVDAVFHGRPRNPWRLKAVRAENNGTWMDADEAGLLGSLKAEE